MSSEEIISKVIIPSLKKSTPSPLIDSVLSKPDKEKICLYGGDGALFDSINLVSFIFTIEELLKSELSFNFQFKVEDVIAAEPKPFSSVKNLADFLAQRIQADD